MTGEKNRFKTTEKLWNLDDKQLKSPKHDAMVLWLMDSNNLTPLLDGLGENFTQKHKLIDGEINGGPSFIIKSEVPLQANNGFINGYADLIIKKDSVRNINHISCDLSETLYKEICDSNTIKDIVNCIEKYEGQPVDTLHLNKKFHYTCAVNEEMLSELERFNDFTKRDYYLRKKEYESIKYGACDEDFKISDFMANSSFEVPDPRLAESYFLHRWITEDNYYEYEHNKIEVLIEVKPYIDSFGAVLRQLHSYARFWKPRIYESYIILFTFDKRFDNQFESQGITVLHPPEDVTVEDMMEYYGLR